MASDIIAAMRLARVAHLAVALAALGAAAPARADRLAGAQAPWLGIRLGGTSTLVTAAGGVAGGGGAGAYALFDARDFLADLSFDAYFGDRARLVAAGLGAYYTFLPGNFSPYAGGGLKVGWTRFGGDGAFGIIPYAAGGMVVGRNWYPQLRVELAYFVQTAREQVAGVPGDGVRAHGLMATFGLAF